MLARLPKPIVIAMLVLGAFLAMPTVSQALVGALSGEPGLLIGLGLLAAVIAGLRWLAKAPREDRTAESVRAASVAIVAAVPPVARAIAGGTRWLLDTVKSAVIFLRGCRWPKALI